MRRRRKKRRGCLLCLIIGLLLIVGIVTVYLRALKPQQQRAAYPLSYENIIYNNCAALELDAYLVAAMIYCESAYVPTAVSGVGARGLMQIMPDTADWLAWRLKIQDFSYDRLFDPEMNIYMGCAYLAFLKERYHDDIPCTVAAYHGGHSRMDQWLKDPRISADGKTITQLPKSDTEHYLKWVLHVYEIYRELYPQAFWPENFSDAADDVDPYGMQRSRAD